MPYRMAGQLCPFSRLRTLLRSGYPLSEDVQVIHDTQIFVYNVINDSSETVLHVFVELRGAENIVSQSGSKFGS